MQPVPLLQCQSSSGSVGSTYDQHSEEPGSNLGWSQCPICVGLMWNVSYLASLIYGMMHSNCRENYSNVYVYYMYSQWNCHLHICLWLQHTNSTCTYRICQRPLLPGYVKWSPDLLGVCQCHLEWQPWLDHPEWVTQHGSYCSDHGSRQFSLGLPLE